VGTVVLFLILGLDVAIVLGALIWLSERRAEADTLDMRKRDRMRRRYR